MELCRRKVSGPEEYDRKYNFNNLSKDTSEYGQIMAQS